MIEFLMTWGASEAVKFIAQEVIGELAKGASEDYVKDFFKQGISDVIAGINHGKPLQKATAQAVKYFSPFFQFLGALPPSKMKKRKKIFIPPLLVYN